MNKKYVIIVVVLFVWNLSHANMFEVDTSFSPEVKSPFFTQHHPIILFDRAHNNLCVNDGRYDPLLHLLKSDGYELVSLTTSLTSDSLKNVKIFYSSAAQFPKEDSNLAQANSAFTEQEMSTIQTWVKQGGSLLLMADHKPIGNDVHPLASKFGLTISDGETSDPQNYLPALKDTSHLLFSRQSALIKDHPITSGMSQREMLNVIVAFCGQSIKVIDDSEIIFALSPNAVMRFEDESKIPLGPGYAEAVSLKYGKGKVVVFGDGTVFTSKIHIAKQEKEGMNRTDIDNVQLAINTFRWLAGAFDDYPKMR